MKKIKDMIEGWLLLLLLCSPFIIIILCFILWIVALVMYGRTPITEVPAWAYMFLHN
jgi:hypothetical protein